MLAKNLVSIKINQEIKLIIHCSDETASLFGPYLPSPPKGGGGGGVGEVVERALPRKFVGGVCLLPKTLTLFKSKIFDYFVRAVAGQRTMLSLYWKILIVC